MVCHVVVDALPQLLAWQGDGRGVVVVLFLSTNVVVVVAVVVAVAVAVVLLLLVGGHQLPQSSSVLLSNTLALGSRTQGETENVVVVLVVVLVVVCCCCVPIRDTFLAINFSRKHSATGLGNWYHDTQGTSLHFGFANSAPSSLWGRWSDFKKNLLFAHNSSG